MDKFECKPTVKSLQECIYKDETTETCGPTEGAGVKCYNTAGKIHYEVSQHKTRMSCTCERLAVEYFNA